VTGTRTTTPTMPAFRASRPPTPTEPSWDAVLLVNRHQASGSQADDQPFCGSGGYPLGLQMVTLCTTHEAFHRMFNDEPEFGIPYDDDVEGPALGTIGERVEGTSVFDGWGPPVPQRGGQDERARCLRGAGGAR
jgi:hypothetical protein